MKTHAAVKSCDRQVKKKKKKKVQMDATMLKLNDINPGLVNVRTYACSHERK